MKKQYICYILLLFLVISCLSCKSIDTVAPPPDVSIYKELPKSVAVLPFINKTSNPEASELVRKVFANFFSSLRYTDIELFRIDQLIKEKGLYDRIISENDVSFTELGNLLGVDAVIVGEVVSFGKTFALVYSDFHAQLSAKMINCRTGKLIWEGRDSASKRDIDIPTSPFGAIASLIEKVVRSKLEKMVDIKVTSMLCHRMVSTIPDLPYVEGIGPRITVFLHNGTKKLFKPGDELRVILSGEPGQTGSWDIMPIRKGLPLEEREPGIYYGIYTVKQDDKLFKGKLVGYLESELGIKNSMYDIFDSVYLGQPTILPNKIVGDVLLSFSKSPYLVEDILAVSQQARLIIEPGTVILLKGIGIVVMGGEIISKGTERMPIKFINIDKESKSSILIDQSAKSNKFSYCNILNNNIGITAMSSNVKIDNCILQNNIKGMIFDKSIVTVENSVIRSSENIGIFAKKGSLKMKIVPFLRMQMVGFF